MTVKIIRHSVFKDHRGYYWTTWKKGMLNKIKFNHDKFSVSKLSIIRVSPTRVIIGAQ